MAAVGGGFPGRALFTKFCSTCAKVSDRYDGTGTHVIGTYTEANERDSTKKYIVEGTNLSSDSVLELISRRLCNSNR